MTLPRAARLRWSLVAGLTGALVAPAWQAFSWAQQPEQEKVAVKASDLPEGAIDLTDKVTVTVNGGLRSTARTDHSAAFSIENISTEDLKGPLVVVVDGTGIATLVVEDEAGTLPTGQPYIDVLEKRGTLRAGVTLRTQKLTFSSDDALTLAQRQQFELKVRVLYLPEEARTAQSESEDDDNIPGKSYSEKEFDRIAAIQEKWTIPLIARGDGLVYGTGLAENDDGELYVKVYAQRPGVADKLPKEIDGIPVRIMGIGEPFYAGPSFDNLIYVDGKPVKAGTLDEDEEVEAGPEPDGVPPGVSRPRVSETPLPILTDPTQRFARPVPIGTSISNADRLFDIIPRALCYSGTLGCRCVDPLGQEYILTNCHVGGAFYDPTVAQPLFLYGIIGERIVQPSTGDLLPFSCELIPTDVLGTVADFELITTTTIAIAASGAAPPHIMDVCIIETLPGTVGFAPPPGTYAGVKRDVLHRPRLGTQVEKAGRTTLFTDGQITGMNVAAIVTIGGARVAFFIKQFEVANMVAGGHPFGQPGDSGSLIVAYDPGGENDGKPVALLFAGGPSGAVDATLANPIGPILARFNLMIDDGEGPPFHAGHSGTSGGAVGPLDPPSYLK